MPYPRANVVLDKYFENFERYGNLRLDRPLIIGDATRMPFKDEAFDFIIASHILEHMDDPALFLKELTRVGKAGYIETPNILFETLSPYRFHRLYIHLKDNKLFIRKKLGSWRGDPLLFDCISEGYSKIRNSQILFRKYPEAFYVRYYWQGNISYQIINQEEQFDWEIKRLPTRYHKPNLLRRMMRELAYNLYSPKKQNTNLNIMSLLSCPKCRKALIKDKMHLTCTGCGREFPVKKGIPILLL